jgi:hypothetical protein
MDLDAVLEDPVRLLQVADALHGAQHVLGAGHQAARQIHRLLRHRALLHVVEGQTIGGGLHEVHDVVHLGDQPVDVVAIDRGDERLVQHSTTARVISSHSCSTA